MTAPPRYAPALGLPAYRHRLGRTPHPRTDPAGHSHDRPEPTSPPLTPATWRRHVAWRFGVDLFNHGYWWEAHEWWEAAWHASEDPAARHLLQGLIQVAAALLHRDAGHEAGSRRLWERARGHLAAIPADRAVGLGVDLPALRKRLATALSEPGGGDPAPVVRLREEEPDPEP